jgi:hypothetical protein
LKNRRGGINLTFAATTFPKLMIKSILIALNFQYIDFGNVYIDLVFCNEIRVSKHYCGLKKKNFMQILDQIEASKFSTE